MSCRYNCIAHISMAMIFYFRKNKIFLFLFCTGLPLLNCTFFVNTAADKKEIDLPYEPPKIKFYEPPPLTPVQPEVIFNGSREKKMIALTFDACSTRRPGKYDERITKILVEKKVPATIFLGGKWIEDNIEDAKYLASQPLFELGNHSFLHPHMRGLSDKRIQTELFWTQAVLYTVTGRQAKLFRAPYGQYNSRIVRLAAEAGMKTIQYDLASGDPDASISKERLAKYVIRAARPGSIIVMHINRRGWHTHQALPEIIDSLRKKGFIFVTVSDLLKNANTPGSLIRLKHRLKELWM